MMEVAIVLKSPNLKNRVIEENCIIAADAGYLYAVSQNKKVDLVIGDFDSSEKPKNCNIETLNPIKDVTDGQACLEYITTKGYKSVAIYGITGGSLDHILCNLSLLINANKNNIEAVGRDDGLDVYYLEKGHYVFEITNGNRFSLIPFMSDSTITNGKGMMYPINDLSITKDSLGRGVSNVAIENEISFDVVDGGLLLFKYL